ncbi:unnamed protein product [Dovyalis caffra]|uniref:Uncharacterized protein n=1 Tax=Dovyalis caffra TaxID=77055 RepID=A0AAV1QXA9_9ROSI|nr:unnamed protein product [Dovyalis caffra]
MAGIADKYLMIMMKILLALFIAFLLMFAALQADAEKLTTLEPKVANRHLLSEPSSLGRKGNAGAYDLNSTPASNKGNTDTETKTGSDGSIDDDDETNRSFGNYGSEGSSTETHHHYTTETRPGRN